MMIIDIAHMMKTILCDFSHRLATVFLVFAATTYFILTTIQSISLGFGSCYFGAI